MPAPRIAVLLPRPLDGTYDYLPPAGANLAPGDIVRVPFGRGQAIGVVWGEGEGQIDEARLKPVGERLDMPRLPEELRRTIAFTARYTLAPLGAVLRMALSVPEALEPRRIAWVYRAGAADRARTPSQRKALAGLGDARMTAAELARSAGVGAAVVKALIASGALVAEALPEAVPEAPDPDHPGPDLEAEQKIAAADLAARVERGGFGVVLLDGVTGSGKTEVYFEAIAAALRAGKQALVLVPEIALTAQWLDRFRRRFGQAPVPWHSDLTAARRRDLWRAIARGQAPVVVGARSALFLPMPNLGVVVVDEEHDQGFKQDDGVIYHARDIAIARAREAGVPAVLASATPSLETLANVDSGRYARLTLSRRYGAAAMPALAAIDLRRDPPERGRWLSPVLIEALRRTLTEGQQALLFLNRRGYAPLTLCRTCGHRLQCPQCSAWLVEHRRRGRLQCHHCGTESAKPTRCPECGAENNLVACGPGIERVAEEAAELFPTARIAVVSSDTLTGPDSVRALIARIERREIDLLIGTQLLAKGHHFPGLTLVGVVDADLGLAGGDLRAAERTFQLLTQVAGRAGRAESAGKALLQSWQPEHPVLAALVSGDRDRFIAAESAERRRATMPPYGRLAALILSGPVEARVAEAARSLARAGPRIVGVHVHGPAPAPLSLLRGQYRYRLLLQAPRDVAIQPLLREWRDRNALPNGVTLRIDVDPYHFL
ncbi:MAG: primosomal protein N' [Alphaproteobacteria bacterium]|nr:primosomal protein N' [Alphaproteobacteria bacterium]